MYLDEHSAQIAMFERPWCEVCIVMGGVDNEYWEETSPQDIVRGLHSFLMYTMLEKMSRLPKTIYPV